MAEAELDLLQNYLTVGAIVFMLGVVGLIARRNLIVMFLCAEMMLQGVSITLVAFSRFHNDWGGQMLVVFIIAVAACEAAIALALILMLYARAGKLDAAYWQEMREENVPPYIDREVPLERLEERRWPDLAPAGVAPEINEEEQSHRSHV
ncbi:MAG: NADH-quinone oxidoreductase subunit NuoK [Pirellulales bacterium]|nr:NADH-quinone oxidoreductase subunit NuoK [Pirellulales bacterium]